MLKLKRNVCISSPSHLLKLDRDRALYLNCVEYRYPIARGPCQTFPMTRRSPHCRGQKGGIADANKFASLFSSWNTQPWLKKLLQLQRNMSRTQETKRYKKNKN